MSGSRSHWIGALAVAVLIGVSVYWFAGYALTAAATGIAWGVSIALVLVIKRRFPSFLTGESWQDSRWTGLSSGLTVGAALLGVSPSLPITAELRLALGLLALGVGLAAYTAGTLAVLEIIHASEGDAEPLQQDADGKISKPGD